MNEQSDPLPHPVLGDRFNRCVRVRRPPPRPPSAEVDDHFVPDTPDVGVQLVLEDGGDEDQAIAALLHDGPEDQGGQATLDEIRRRFGDRVATLVDGLTDTLKSPKPKWGPRKRDYLTRVKDEPVSVLRVSLADKLHNLRSVAVDLEHSGADVWGRFNAGRKQQEWYYRELLEVFERRLPMSRNLPEFRHLVGDVFGPDGTSG